jgi:hypothetical protein
MTASEKKEQPKKELTESDKIWHEIKDKPIDMYSLPDQVVSDHCTPLPVDPNKLYLTLKSAAALPALEIALGVKFTFELAEKYVIIKRA